MILKGDCIEVMKAMKPNSVDAIVTDPPYGLEFMGKQWDKLWDKREFGIDEYSKKSYKCSDGSTRKTNPVSRKLSNPNYKAGLEMQLWHTQWLTEAYRVLKPGGSMLVMGGTRTSHRLACAIEDTGFIIKDTLMWLYGAGFPKCQDITPRIDGKMLGITTKQVKERREVIGKKIDISSGKAMSSKQAKAGSGKNIHEGWDRPWRKDDSHCEQMTNITKPLTEEAKHWDGFKVGGIKPAYEPIIWAVKPPEGSYVDNVLKWGVGAVNVDETRINYQNNETPESINKSSGISGGMFGTGKSSHMETKGRFPANVILSHHPECVQVGMKRVKSDKGGEGEYPPGIFGIKETGRHYAGPNGLETVESWNCHPDCAVRLLDEQSGVLTSGTSPSSRNADKSRACYGGFKGQREAPSRGANSGGASRFFYCAKASRGERNAGLKGMEEKKKYQDFGLKERMENGAITNKRINIQAKASKNNHPTVKPIKLFEWLIKLVTREGQIILDPFIGSGTTAIAAHNTGRKSIGMEKEDEYLTIAKRRISHWQNQPKQEILNLGE